MFGCFNKGNETILHQARHCVCEGCIRLLEHNEQNSTLIGTTIKKNNDSFLYNFIQILRNSKDKSFPIIILGINQLRMNILVKCVRLGEK